MRKTLPSLAIGYPGPMHVLDMTAAVAWFPEQPRSIADPLGVEILHRERERKRRSGPAGATDRDSHRHRRGD